MSAGKFPEVSQKIKKTTVFARFFGNFVPLYGNFNKVKIEKIIMDKEVPTNKSISKNTV